MSAPLCTVCLDTGSKSQYADGDLDCVACDAATERAAMNRAIKQREDELMDEYRLSTFDPKWFSYQLGKAAAAAAPVVPVAAQPVVPMPKGEFNHYGLSSGQLKELLNAGLKPEEISGADDVQHDRVHELVWWFSRLTQGHANAKWAIRHACELAYFIANNGVNRNIDLEAIRTSAFKEAVNISPAERSTLERIGFAAPQPAASVTDVAKDDLVKAVGMLVKAKGRYHTVQNYVAVVAAYDAAIAAQQGEKTK